MNTEEEAGEPAQEGKKQKRSSKDTAAKEKQKRVAACDVCRLRKVRCVKEGKEGGRCVGCTELNRECTYEYLPKRPGPPNPYARPSFGHGMAPSERYAPYPSSNHGNPHSSGDPLHTGSATTTGDGYPHSSSAGHEFTSPSHPFHHLGPPPVPTDDFRTMGELDRHPVGYGSGNGLGNHPHHRHHPMHFPPPPPPPSRQALERSLPHHSPFRHNHHSQQHDYDGRHLTQHAMNTMLPQAESNLSATGHTLPPPDNGQPPSLPSGRYPSHISMSASSPSLSGASGYSPNNPQLPPPGNLDGASGSRSHYPAGDGNGRTNGTGMEKSVPVSSITNHASLSSYPTSADRARGKLATEAEADTMANGTTSLGLTTAAAANLDDNWFMPWICSTPGGNGDHHAPGTPAAGYTYTGGGYTGHIPRALLPGDLSGPPPPPPLGSVSTWHDSLAAVTQGPSHAHQRPRVTMPTTMMDHHERQQVSSGGRDMYQTSHIPAAGTTTMMPFDDGGQRPRYGTAGRESFTSTSDKDAPRGSGKMMLSATAAAVASASAQVVVVDIEDIVSWSHVLSFLSLYHEHLYPLLPLMHWPSFSQLLISRHDKQDIVFRCFLLSLVAYSILQLPKSVIPPLFSQEELVALHRKCHQASRRMQTRVYDPLELNHISTLYCDHIYLGSTGKDNAANVVLAEAMRLAITLALHDENVAEQQGLDAIERDCRRRVFWILYGSDRTIAALISCPMLLSDDDIDVGDILECDDSLITAAGAFPQPAGKTPILSGFIHVTRIFRLLSRVLRYVRAKAKSNGRDDGNGGGEEGMNTDRGYERFPDPRVLIESLQALLDDLPAPLRLQSHNTEHRSKAEAQAFDTCKANILVSQVLVRFAIYQYAMLHSTGQPETCLTELTDDVLCRLHEMSSESLAANGESIRHKVLFIASSLLNKYPGNNAGADHVAEFLAVYNKILTNQNKLGMDAEIVVDGEPAGEDG